MQAKAGGERSGDLLLVPGSKTNFSDRTSPFLVSGSTPDLRRGHALGHPTAEYSAHHKSNKRKNAYQTLQQDSRGVPTNQSPTQIVTIIRQNQNPGQNRQVSQRLNSDIENMHQHGQSKGAKMVHANRTAGVVQLRAADGSSQTEILDPHEDFDEHS